MCCNGSFYLPFEVVLAGAYLEVQFGYAEVHLGVAHHREKSLCAHGGFAVGVMLQIFEAEFLLIDGGNCGDAAKLIDNIWRLGFDPAKIRWMVVSHGHVDHFGVANYLKTVYDTKLFMGAPDAEMLKKEPELALIQNSNDLSEIIPEVDVPIHDCDEINFGNLKARFRLVPGHTDGSIAMFFDMEEDGVIRHVGYYGGLGLNTMEREYLLQRGDPNCEKRKEYLQSIESVRDEAVDVVLGNHTEHGDVLDKRKRQLAGYYGNPFIDPTDWNRLLDEWSEKMKALMH